MKNIVVIEDDSEIRNIFNLALDNNSYTITPYESAEAFLKNPPVSLSLIIVDKSLPGMSGLILCEQLRKMEAYLTIPIVMMSADHDFTTAAKAAGVNDVLPKPFRLAVLRKIVAEYAGK